MRSLALPAAAGARERWATDVFSLVPRPGFPAHAYVHPNGRVYEGTYDNPSGDSVPSKVFEWSPGGTLLRSWTMHGQDLSKPHGVQTAGADAGGRLVLLDKSPPRVVVMNLRTGRTATYSEIPQPATPNYAAWGPDGSLYVSDYEHAVLWRVPPRGGDAVPWLRDARLDGGPFGGTGLVLAADRKTLLLGMMGEAGAAAGNPSTPRIWAIPIGDDGRPGPMRQLWEGRPLDAIDGFALARSGTIYGALLVPNQIIRIGADGKELERFPSGPGGANGSTIPFDAPSSVEFLGTRLLVANQSYFTGDATHQAILDVEAGEPGLEPYIPANAGYRNRAAKRRPARR